VCVRTFGNSRFYPCIKLDADEVTSVQVGINYTGTAMELNGCVNDARNVRNFLMSGFYAPSSIAVPSTDPPDRKLEL